MNELTTKWLNREIDRGSFYVKTKLGNILVDHYDIDLPNFNGFQSDVKEIIERVPCYEEFTSIRNENEEAKALLKEAYKRIPKDPINLKLLEKIEEFLKWIY